MGIKAYKGFDKDMTCRGFQFEEGKTYHEDKAELCKSGFHACLNPLDCFRYYNPNNSEYHEVEVDEILGGDIDDTKICTTDIKIGAKLDVLGICKAHFEYVKSKTTSTKQGVDNNDLAARNGSSLAAQDRSSLAAQNESSLAAQDESSLAAQDESSLAARNWSSLAAQDESSLAAQDRSSLAAQNESSLAAQDESSLAAQNESSLAARNWSSLAAQDRSSLAAQDWSSLAAQDGSSLAAGEDSILCAFNSKAKAGLNSVIVLANREWIDYKCKITDFAAAVVDGEKIKADTWYKLENGEFVEVEEKD